MSGKPPTLEEWRRLYQRATSVKELAPWEWMEELDLFAVENPETGTHGFVSVMGELGEHFAVSVYLGAEGVYGFWELQEAGPSTFTEQLLQIPQLQVSFEDRKLLDKEDLATIKKLGLTFRGRNAWPMFRSFRPGYLPWHLESQEARFLEMVLEQVLDVAPRCKEDISLLPPSEDDEYFLRAPSQKKDHLAWEDGVLHVEPPKPRTILVGIDTDVLRDLREFRPSENMFEMDVFMAPVPVQEKGNRPFLPYVLMIVDCDSGAILCQELLAPLPSLEEMWGKVPGMVADELLTLGGVPKDIAVMSEFLFQLLQPLSEAVGLTVTYTPILPTLQRAKDAFLEIMTKRIR